MAATSRFVSALKSADNAARTAAIFGYSANSVINSRATSQQNWWTDERIESIVTSEFVASRLQPEERARLRSSPASAGDLTDELYIDWILTRARRIFLVLVECHVADSIFGVIEDAWNDDDLPLALEDISKLKLSKKPDEHLCQKFHAAQFQFLLRPLKKGQHITYNADEIIPLDYVPRVAPSAPIQHWLRVRLPRTPGREFVQRKLPLGQDGVDSKTPAQFHADVQVTESIRCPHLAPIWATYVFDKSAFLVTDFVSEHTLKTLLDSRNPASLSKVDDDERAVVVIQWLHCLASAVASLHQQGVSHSAIAPDNIIIDKNNNIAFADIGSLKTFQLDKKLERDEMYIYGAPETIPESQRVISPAPSLPKSARTLTSPNLRMFLRRRKSNDSRLSIDSCATGPSPLGGRCDSSAASVMSTETTQPSIFDGGRTSRGAVTFLESATSLATTNQTTEPSSSTSNGSSTTLEGSGSQSNPTEAAQTADVYSLGCVCLDILSFAVKRKPYSEFIRHRSTSYKTSKWKVPVVDSSFHSNFPKVLAWMDILEVETYGFEGPVFSAYPDLLQLIREMVQQEPTARPSAMNVKERLTSILTDVGKMELHCSDGGLTPVAEPKEEADAKDKATSTVKRTASGNKAEHKENGDATGVDTTEDNEGLDSISELPEVMDFPTSDPKRSDSTAAWSAHVTERFRYMLEDVGSLPFLDEEEMDLRLKDYAPAEQIEKKPLRSQRSAAMLSASQMKEKLRSALHRGPVHIETPRDPPPGLLVDLPRLDPITFEGLMDGEDSPKTPSSDIDFDTPTQSPLKGQGMLAVDFTHAPLEIPGLKDLSDSKEGVRKQQQRQSTVDPATLLPDPRDPRNNMRKRKDLEYPSPHPPDYFSYRNSVDGYGLYKQTLREFDILVGYSEDTKQTLAELDLVGEFWDD